MSVKTQYLAGCCAGKIWYDVGTAHSWKTQPDQKSFDKMMMKFVPALINIIVLDGQQRKEKEYLLAQGWSPKEVGPLTVYTISGSDLMKYFKQAKEQEKKESVVLPEDVKKRVFLRDIERHIGRAPGHLLEPNRIVSLNRIYGIEINQSYSNYLHISPHTVFNIIKSLVAQRNKNLREQKAVEDAVRPA